MRIVFVSDLHLSEDTDNNNQIFLSYMQQWQNANIVALYILGDFFDYWLGDDDSNPFITSIKASFKQFTRTTPIYFIGGNHDFAVGKKFAKDTGIKLLTDCSVIDVEKQRILISHGDIFCSLDKKYQKMKKILQNPLVIYLLTKTPLAFRRKIKDLLEKKSTDSYNPQKSPMYNVVDSTIAKYVSKHNISTVIHGHTHNPGYYLLNANGNDIPRIELPDWIGHSGGYLLYENGKFQFINTKLQEIIT